ncbi:ExeM/NucH family extracellular endonuclease [Hydrogenophaga sp. ANAO-22]|uniref:ExeM/NucH family extracellular endonuclease n=1 Tax=Hydrogenophaga sp. ANAO-22 TaxID=3166645 RepID=UPI0036D3E029
MKPTLVPRCPSVQRRLPACLMALGLLTAPSVWADTVAQSLPFQQNWSNAGLITAADNWSGVPGIVGYRGDDLVTSTGANPQTVLGVGSQVVNVLANQTNPNTLTNGGVAEFEIANPVVALNGSGTADAPNLVIHLNTTGQQDIRVAYTLRDLDGSSDDAVQPFALQYRVGNTGNFINVPAGFVADATTGPNLATATFPVSVVLPAAANNQAQLQVRIITTNAVGNDEWVGIDDIAITGTPVGGTINQPIATACPAGSAFDQGVGGTLALSATDSDSVVNGLTLGNGTPAGISLDGFQPAVADGGTATASLVVAGSLAAGSYPVQVTFSNNELQTALCNLTVTVNGSLTIPQVQGSGAQSPLVGQAATVRGVVTLVTNNGFFLQDQVGDGDASTSDGLFVFTSSTPGANVVAGNELSVTGTVTEYRTGTGAQAVARPLTQLTTPTIALLSTGHTVAPTVITLPEVAEGELERYEGMLVHIATPLTASQNFFQGRYGQVTLSAEGRLEKPTNRHPAGSVEALAMEDENARRRILLDDGLSIQNPDPTPYLGADTTLRAGDVLPSGVTGVIDYGLATNLTDGISDYKIHPTEPVVFSRENARPGTPAPVGGNVRVGAFNVLNYFTTIDQAGASCFPGGGRSDCRGADSAAEFTRQRDKIVKAIVGLNADVVGLMEIENNGNTAVQNLVSGLNAVAGANTYATIAMPTGGSGTDAIRVAMIYKPGKLSPVGQARSDTNSVHNRPPLAQTFAAANGERFSVVVNHFKSKGSCPSGSGADADAGDGQGCWNATRVDQAQALLGFISQIQSTSGSNDVMVVGDINAYGKEDPILELTNNGLVDEIARFNAFGYSYVFDGEAGYLDHGLATASLSAKVTGAIHWRINADEPSVIDYNTEFKLTDYYTNTVYRSSDHDPVLVGLALRKAVNGTASRDTLVGTAGDDVITGGPGADVLTGGAGADVFVYTDLRDAGDRVTDFAPGTDRIDLTALLQSIGYTGGNAIADGVVRLVDSAAGLVVQIDADGHAGPLAARPLLTLSGVNAAQIVAARDLGL